MILVLLGVVNKKDQSADSSTITKEEMIDEIDKFKIDIKNDKE